MRRRGYREQNSQAEYELQDRPFAGSPDAHKTAVSNIHDTVYEKHGGRGSGSGSEEMILREDKSNTGIMRTTEISVQR